MELKLVEFVVRSVLIALAFGMALRFLRIRRAAVRHAAWVGVIVAMILLPAWMAFGPKARVRVLPAQPDAPFATAVLVPVPEAVEIPDVAPVLRQSRWDWSALPLGVYGAGVAVLFLRLAIGTIRARRLTSALCAAPVTVGLWRPRVILPESANEWMQGQLQVVMAHEREHARRHDPLYQWLALFNRAVFWFHPLAWWLERQIGALAEEACDEAVIEQGYNAREYSLLLLDLARTVEHLGTRVNAVAMTMPGVYLPNRIKSIMSGVRAQRVSGTRLGFATLACAIPAALFASGTVERAPQLLRLAPLPALAMPKPPELIPQVKKEAPVPKLEFEAATIQPATPPVGRRTPIGGGPGTSHPEGVNYPNLTIKRLLTRAYGMPLTQIIGPSWIDVDRFDITAKVPPGATKQDVNVMLQSLLADRLKLVVHRETREMQLYELTVAAVGSKLKSYVERLVVPFGMVVIDKSHPLPPPGEVLFTLGPKTRKMAASRATVGSLANTLGFELGCPVVDKTGLTGFYDYVFEYQPGPSPGDGLVPSPGQSANDAPDLFAALTAQFGLKLDAKTGPIEVLVVDSGQETPVEN